MDKVNNKYAEIEWREDGQPLSRTYDDIYFSSASGLEETRYVFLQQNTLAERWQRLGKDGVFTIAETGFGTGLNFIAAAELWQQTAPESARLHFISVEKFPLRRNDLRRALDLWPQLASLAQSLIDNYPPLLATGVHRLQFGQISLTLIIGEASQALSSLRLQRDSDHQVDAWFLDGFAPAKNPDMWTPELFANMAALSGPGATLATFTCAGLVKRGLRDAGFALRKVPGFAHKREMLCGTLESSQSLETRETPWHLPKEENQLPQTVAVVGAGIASATAARALAERGLRVQVFEQGEEPGSGGSGNDQGILYAKLSPKPGPNGDFNLHALMFAQRYYHSRCPDVSHFSGLLQLAQTERQQQLQDQVATTLAKSDGQFLAEPVDAHTASLLAGVVLPFGGLHFPRAGWIEPKKVCATLLQHPNITLHSNHSVLELHQNPTDWLLKTDRSDVSADAVVLCGANDIRQFAATAPLPLKPIRGQVSKARATEGSSRLKVALCGEGYITPAHCGSQSFGATFKLKETATELRDSEHGENLQTLAGLLPQVAEDFADQTLTGRAALRAATPDYLPLAGPVPDWASIGRTYEALRKNRKQFIPARADYHRGLYVMGGLGSRGFTYAPLTAEVLASWILHDPLPVSATLAKALHPTRFAIRDLGRNRDIS
ncbi:bifunctional tRNA (5-methylaminomethyl-2-thiouridine)(34)-methyltransferase MnmD/FAD-dependent 5-carboxymethylaminomethyl-2-thiouridine(34) oxidoreductase MnmC [Microbulbifer sp. OS29]|uniref:tRNA 5-methylaminomethyl-2-thiouridine biosynthesis bifunctional protein MnmC n=1 Tax=Microbulbifer okhotskensis TaxID=2926617 RepID=A0A9X2J5I8_9GAMM|nr:bifunctional tRNA (5-methylaminomethyl-2-thiouridine)(34)-methyltransferase MnmD/FAD-dependent 5-carboxymethylaminomethyl-2-thiouridine(34) oxidoreductase MnmC [Microbulbifer okhotskensis]MCO1335248.1 bifunctional tRNA (5-methylaminomethyl-2-thiouridine)(34)-methyltransferase MnmD/FAD-dependent 5-carboxymethylaminomethyl-2-thiouridine(34) oxidoreductase MnmC [Microbulbifer okhotskensis]